MSTFLLLLVLLITVVFYERRWKRTRRLIRDLCESIESGQRLLLDSDRRLASSLGADELLRSVQRMMDERARVRARNASQLEQIKATFRNMTEGALLTNEENSVVVSNHSADQLLNEGRSLVGKRIEKFIHHPEFLDFAQTLKGSGEHGRRQIRVDLLGKMAWLEISGAALEVPNGETRPALTLFLINDITRIKKLEAIRRDFAANVSHEMRTPITILKGFIETLHEKGDQLTEEQRRSFTEKVYRNTERLNALVEDLLSLSRLESRSLELRREPHCLQQEIRAFAADFESRKTPDIPIRLNLPEEPVEAEVDRVFLARILDNLVGNALSHGKTLTWVEVRLRHDKENELVELIVEDDGVGIPESARERIFQRFYRVDIGHSRQTGGTGLGLSIVRHAMLAHGGNVRVEPVDPHGTRFVCVFPGKTG